MQFHVEKGEVNAGLVVSKLRLDRGSMLLLSSVFVSKDDSTYQSASTSFVHRDSLICFRHERKMLVATRLLTVLGTTLFRSLPLLLY